MPNRILRDGILRSEKLASVSPQAELFYRRLMSVVDDFGRYYAHPSLLLSDCYPIRPSWADEQSLTLWIEECCSSGLLTRYTVAEKNYLVINNFRQRIREKVDSKFPSPEGLCGDSPRVAAERGGMPRDAARATPTPPSSPTPPKGVQGETEDPEVEIRNLIREYGEEFGVVLEPDINAVFRLCRSMLTAGKTLDDFERIIRELVATKQKPKSMGHVITIVEGKLSYVS